MTRFTEPIKLRSGRSVTVRHTLTMVQTRLPMPRLRLPSVVRICTMKRWLPFRSRPVLDGRRFHVALGGADRGDDFFRNDAAHPRDVFFGDLARLFAFWIPPWHMTWNGQNTRGRALGCLP